MDRRDGAAYDAFYTGSWGRLFGQAYGKLEGVLRQDPERKAARRRLIQMLMAAPMWRYQDAKEHLDILIKQSTSKQSAYEAELYALLGQALQKVRRKMEAGGGCGDAAGMFAGVGINGLIPLAVGSGFFGLAGVLALAGDVGWQGDMADGI